MSNVAQKKLLVFGGSGMLGKRVVAAAFRAGWADVIAPSSKACNIARLYDVAQWVNNVRPDVILNCAGLIPPRNAGTAAVVAVNALSPYHVAAAAELVDARVIHVSTDCVFSGRHNPSGWWHATDELPDPADLYGRSKLLGEVTAPNVTNVRTSFVGPEHGLMRWLMNHEPESEVDGWTGAQWSGSTVGAVATALVRMAAEHERPTNGVIHLAAPEPISKYVALAIMNQVLSLRLYVRQTESPEVDRSLKASPGWELPHLIDALRAERCN